MVLWDSVTLKIVDLELLSGSEAVPHYVRREIVSDVFNLTFSSKTSPSQPDAVRSFDEADDQLFVCGGARKKQLLRGTSWSSRFSVSSEAH